ncbi:MAG: hypothetical protein IPG89_21350 [Bacteroidetes bacterium]|nr:hypothetical protein [Bacteroidota bacterium]
MYKAALIFVLCAFTLNKGELNRYEKIFSTDFTNALSYLNTHSKQFKQSAKAYGNQPQLLSTIVFPELMRYSNVKDILETSALELVYIESGSSVADFSIGRFQMKPSFAESIEEEVKSDAILNTNYKKLNFAEKNSKEQNRKERIARLQNLDWQLLYLNAFVSVCKIKFKNEKFESTEDSLSFYSSAYNTGFTKSSEEIRSNCLKCYFPYGTKYKGKQYSYADVACYFNKYTFGKTKNSPTLK